MAVRDVLHGIHAQWLWMHGRVLMIAAGTLQAQWLWMHGCCPHAGAGRKPKEGCPRARYSMRFIAHL